MFWCSKATWGKTVCIHLLQITMLMHLLTHTLLFATPSKLVKPQMIKKVKKPRRGGQWGWGCYSNGTWVTLTLHSSQLCSFKYSNGDEVSPSKYRDHSRTARCFVCATQPQCYVLPTKIIGSLSTLKNWEVLYHNSDGTYQQQTVMNNTIVMIPVKGDF